MLKKLSFLVTLSLVLFTGTLFSQSSGGTTNTSTPNNFLVFSKFSGGPLYTQPGYVAPTFNDTGFPNTLNFKLSVLGNANINGTTYYYQEVITPTGLVWRFTWGGSYYIDYVASGNLLVNSNYLASNAPPTVVQTLVNATRPIGQVLAEPVETGSGAEIESKTLLTLTGARPLDFTISYNSQDTANNTPITVTTTNGTNVSSSTFLPIYIPGSMGQWTHNYEGQALYSTSSTCVTNSQPQVILSLSHRRWCFFFDGTKWTTQDPASKYDRLTVFSNGCTLTLPSQSKYTFAGTNGWYLTQAVNPNGQALIVTRDSNNPAKILSVCEPVSGKAISFQYVPDRDLGGGCIAYSPLILSSISDSTGRTVSFTYTNNQLLSSLTEANGQKTTYSYDSLGQLLTIRDSAGKFLVSSIYDQNGRVIKQYDARGSVCYFAYNAQTNSSGLITNITTLYTDRNGYNTTYVLDGQANILTKTTSLGEQFSYTYNDAGQVTSATDPLNHTTSITYDQNGNAILVTDSSGAASSLSYDTNNNLLSLTDPDGGIYSYTYDQKNNLLTARDPLGSTLTKTYDTNSLPLSTTFPKGGVSSTTYSSGLPSTLTDPAGNTTSFIWDGVGNPTSITAPNGGVRSFSYGPMREVLSQTDPLGNVTTFSYDYRTRKITQTDAVGAVTRFGYDLNNNLIAITNALGGVANFGYDYEDQRVGATDPLRNETVFAYDPNGRVTGSLDPLNIQNDYYYDDSGNLIASLNGAYQTTFYNYDSRNLLSSVINPLGEISYLTRDSAGRVTSTQDPLSRVTAFVNDAKGRVTKCTDPTGAVTSKGYDPDGGESFLQNALIKTTQINTDLAGRVISYITPLGKTTTLSYNSLGEVASVVQPNGTTSTITYDLAGRVQSFSDPVGTITYSYDAVGRVLSSQSSPTQTNGPPSSGALSRQYDLLGRLTNFTDSQGYSIWYGYDAAGNLTSLTYPDGLKVSYYYDKSSRLTNVTDWAGRKTSYVYDRANRPTSISLPDGSTSGIGYDAAGYVYVTSDVYGTNLIESIISQRDLTGKIINDNYNPLNTNFVAPSLSLPVDADNRLTSINGTNTTYDACGNLLSGNVPGLTPSSISFAYDSRNRLTNASGTIYGYDAENRRTFQATSSVTTTYVTTPIGARGDLDQLLWKINPNGSITRYVYGLGLIGEDNAGNFTTYHYDRRGSTIALTSTNGTVTTRFAYGPHGEPIGFNPSSAPTQLLYNGRYGVQSDQNGLLYMRARYYAPSIDRFINQDTLLGDINPGASLNRFAYCNGDPVNHYDADGRFGKGAAEGVALGGFGQYDNTTQQIAGLVGQVGSYFIPGMQGYSAARDITFSGYSASKAAYDIGENGLNLRNGSELVLSATGLIPGASGVGSAVRGESSAVFQEFRQTITLGAESTAARAADGSIKFKRWARGDAIDKPMPDGAAPSWDVVRSRYWKNRSEAAPAGEFSQANLDRMLRGSAPQDYNSRTGQWESRELHHVDPQRSGGSNGPFNLRELTPDQHRALDPYRQ